MDVTSRPPASLPRSVAPSAPHQVQVCKACIHKGQDCKPGFDVLQRLRAAISAAGLGDAFEVSGTVSLDVCAPDHGRPCVIGWRATERATWLFGDIDPDQPLDDLVDYARTCAMDKGDGRNGQDIAPRRRGPTPARIPAAMIVTRAGVIQ